MKNPKGLSKALSAVGSVSFPRQFAFLEDYFAVLALNHSTNCSMKDFVNPARVKDYETMHHRIFISSTTLHRFLLEAEMKGNASQYRNPFPLGLRSGRGRRHRLR